MLERMNAFTRTWLARAMLFLLVPAFGIWGIGSMFQGRIDTSVAHVGGGTISTDAFNRAYRRQIDLLRQATGVELTPEQLRDEGVPQSVLNSLIQSELFDQDARDHKVVVPDDILVKEIHDIPNFQGTDGKFDPRRYEQVLRQNNLTELRFEASVRRDMKRGELFSALIGGTQLPEAMLKPLFRYRSETRVADYFILPLNKAAHVTLPTEGDISRYYESHKSKFVAPEYRQFTVVRVLPKDLADDNAVTDDDARKYYDSHSAEFITPEQRQIEQIKFASEADAKAASDEIRAGKSFETVAQEHGFSPEDRALGPKTKADLEPALGNAAFSIPEGAVTVPVKGKFGWVILRSTAVTPEKIENFEEAKLQIRAKIAEDRAAEKVNTVATALEDERASAGSLEDAAAAVNKAKGTHIAAQKFTVDAEGKGPDGKPVEALVDYPEILKMAEKSDVNEDTDITPTSDGGYFVVRVDKIIAPKERPLKDVNDTIAKTLTRDRQLRQLDQRAEIIANEVKKGKPFEKVAAGFGRPVQTSAPLPRGGASETFSKEMITKLFQANVGDVVSGAVTVGDSYIFMKLKRISSPKPADAKAQFQKVGQELQRSMANELTLQYANGLKRRYEVRVNTKAFDSAVGGS